MAEAHNGSYSTAKLVWGILAVLVSIGISVGGYAYVAMRGDVAALNSRTTTLEIHDSAGDARYEAFKAQLDRIENNQAAFNKFMLDMTTEQRGRNMFPRSRSQEDNAGPDAGGK